jgi:hypothetical protein
VAPTCASATAAITMVGGALFEIAGTAIAAGVAAVTDPFSDPLLTPHAWHKQNGKSGKKALKRLGDRRCTCRSPLLACPHQVGKI